jgi:signal transduction histidine kinase
VLNLVVNARDSAPKAGILIELRNIAAGVFDPLSWPELAPGDYVECRISDDGAGMSPAVLRRACEPFFTTKTEGKGTGLGLAQVYGFARQSGGSVKIESALGVGTSITILLPRAASPHANGADATEPDTRSENPQTADAG